ncbi:unnamed protein product [Miscanthus lutarioriparius]|uniref:Uncharacterized protein n=1 Tax=Miscanthus lutarioriparius TaxID=422564 RepID=A0A811SKC8_9POAL|nr:unnamed protein product [Miscanthus lutarioriparius]
MPDTESDHHRGVAAIARLDLVAPPAAPATSSSSCATVTATARDEDEEDGFTFAAVAVAVPRLQAADCAFQDARIGVPVYPVFGRPRWSPPKEQQQQQQDEEEEGPGAAGTATVRVPLGRLLVEEPWCDYADAELDGVPAETYCLWSPGVSPPAPTGSSRRASPARCRRSGSRGGGKSSSTSFLPCKQDLVELVASVVTCGRSCYLF